MGANNSNSKQKTITWKELAQHNTEKDCWICVASHVYNITNYLEEHPGGKNVLLKYAGNDGSEAFASVINHQNVQKTLLQNLYVGDIELKPQPTKYKIQALSKNYEKWQYTEEEVNKHNQSDNLWIILDNYILDLTEFQKEHPGGASVIKQVAGKDATSGYNQVSGHPDIEKTSIKYRIGVLKQ